MKLHLGHRIIQRAGRQTVVFGVTCLAGLLLLGITGLYPAHAKGMQLRDRIARLEQKRELQIQLQPLLVSLMTAEDAIPQPARLQVVEPRPLPRDDLLGLDRQIFALAREHRLDPVSVDVKVDAKEGEDLVAVATVLAGDFQAFRPFLLALGQQDWVQEFELLDISGQRNQERLHVEFKMALD